MNRTSHLAVSTVGLIGQTPDTKRSRNFLRVTHFSRAPMSYPAYMKQALLSGARLEGSGHYETP